MTTPPPGPRIRRPLRTNNPRLQNLNPMFHFKTPAEDDRVLTKVLIKQARKSGTLNLSGRGLSFVPEKVWRLHETDADEECEIEYDMDKRATMAASADQYWWNRTNLNTLDLSSNSLTQISGDIQKLSDLTTLNLHDNALSELPVEVGTLERLQRVNCSHNKLVALPYEFFRLRELRYLNLSHNCLIEINADLSDLVMLEELDLSHNALTSLPCGIGFLVRLVSLTVANNKLRDLPNDIVNMRSLKKLDVVHNDLECLPKGMGELRKLECFYVQHNNVKELPDFVGCTALKEIHFANNFIAEVPGDFCENLPQLKVLDLRDNKIERLPDEISMLQSLMRLDLSNNAILTLPNNLCTLAHLVSLQLEGNPLRSIRRDIIQSGTVRILKTLRDRAGFNANGGGSGASDGGCGPTIKEDDQFPDKYKMRKTHSLALSLKGLQQVPEEVFHNALDAEVGVVDLSKNKLMSMPEGLQILTHTLRELDCSANLLREIPVFVSQFDKLVHLNVAKNQLETLPMELALIVSLRELNLNNNPMAMIPACVYELVNLEILLMADNKVTLIDAGALSKLRRLSTLDLSNNNIEQVPPELGNMTQIRMLELNGNKFRQPRHQILAKGTESVMAYLRDRIPKS